jgi:hypothetical protein
MTEVPVNRKEIGSAKSDLNNSKVTLDLVDNKFYVISFNDNKYQYLKNHVSVVLNETPETMYLFFKSVFDDFEKKDVTEKEFKSGDYIITVNYLGNIPERHVSVIFQNNESSKIVAMPFLDFFNWFTLFGDVNPEKQK